MAASSHPITPTSLITAAPVNTKEGVQASHNEAIMRALTAMTEAKHKKSPEIYQFIDALLNHFRNLPPGADTDIDQILRGLQVRCQAKGFVKVSALITQVLQDITYIGNIIVMERLLHESIERLNKIESLSDDAFDKAEKHFSLTCQIIKYRQSIAHSYEELGAMSKALDEYESCEDLLEFFKKNLMTKLTPATQAIAEDHVLTTTFDISYRAQRLYWQIEDVAAAINSFDLCIKTIKRYSANLSDAKKISAADPKILQFRKLFDSHMLDLNVIIPNLMMDAQEYFADKEIQNLKSVCELINQCLISLNSAHEVICQFLQPELRLSGRALVKDYIEKVRYQVEAYCEKSAEIIPAEVVTENKKSPGHIPQKSFIKSELVTTLKSLSSKNPTYTYVQACQYRDIICFFNKQPHTETQQLELAQALLKLKEYFQSNEYLADEVTVIEELNMYLSNEISKFTDDLRQLRNRESAEKLQGLLRHFCQNMLRAAKIHYISNPTSLQAEKQEKYEYTKLELSSLREMISNDRSQFPSPVFKDLEKLFTELLADVLKLKQPEFNKIPKNKPRHAMVEDKKAETPHLIKEIKPKNQHRKTTKGQKKKSVELKQTAKPLSETGSEKVAEIALQSSREIGQAQKAALKAEKIPQANLVPETKHETKLEAKLEAKLEIVKEPEKAIQEKLKNDALRKRAKELSKTILIHSARSIDSVEGSHLLGKTELLHQDKIDRHTLKNKIKAFADQFANVFNLPEYEFKDIDPADTVKLQSYISLYLKEFITEMNSWKQTIDNDDVPSEINFIFSKFRELESKEPDYTFLVGSMAYELSTLKDQEIFSTNQGKVDDRDLVTNAYYKVVRIFPKTTENDEVDASDPELKSQSIISQACRSTSMKGVHFISLDNKPLCEIKQSEYLNHTSLFRNNPLFADSLSRDLYHKNIYLQSQVKNWLVITPVAMTLAARILGKIFYVDRTYNLLASKTPFNPEYSPERLAITEDPIRWLRGVRELYARSHLSPSEGFSATKESKWLPEVFTAFTKNYVAVAQINDFFTKKILDYSDSQSALAIFNHFARWGVISLLFPRLPYTDPICINKLMDLFAKEAPLKAIYLSFFILENYVDIKDFLSRPNNQKEISTFFLERFSASNHLYHGVIDKRNVSGDILKVLAGYFPEIEFCLSTHQAGVFSPVSVVPRGLFSTSGVSALELVPVPTRQGPCK